MDQAVLLPIDCTTAHGCKIVSNEQVAELAYQTTALYRFCFGGPQSGRFALASSNGLYANWAARSKTGSFLAVLSTR